MARTKYCKTKCFYHRCLIWFCNNTENKMPRKRNIPKNKVIIAKQKKLLESRLMRISIVIDECVYQNKNIPASEARAYIEEMASYRAQGIDDARSLQVIEKITRCMKAIIEEQDESHAHHTDTLNVDTCCSSPVYSLPDEDRMMFSQTSMNVHIDTRSNNILDQNCTIDLCDDDNDELHKTVAVDVEIHRAMSGLSIKEDETQISEQFSQSILENFELERVGILKKPTNHFKSPVLNLKSSMSHVTNRTPTIPQKLAIKNVHFKDYDVVFTQPKEPPVIKKRKTVKKLKDDDSKKGTRQKKTRNVKSNEPKKAKKKSDGNKKRAPTPEHIKSKTNDKAGDTTKAAYKNNASSDTAPNTEMNENLITAISPYDRPPLNRVFNSKHLNSIKSMRTIYNNNIENDLSWIENIRFVREVTNDESDTKFSHLEDTFWDNLMFPNDWTDKDFDY